MTRKAATPGKKATKRRAAAKPATPHAVAVVALAFSGGSLFVASIDGRVVRLSDALATEAVLRDTPRDPVTALATAGDRLVAASAKTLVVLDRDGKSLAKAPLAATTVAVVVRGVSIFVLGGGAVRRFELGTKGLRPGGVCKHAKGIATQLDVDDAGEQAVVVLDGHRVELLDLVERERVAEWSRKNVPLSACFAGTAGSLLVVDEEHYGLRRVKAQTGRATGEVTSLDSSVNGPIVLDVGRKAAAIRSTGEDIEVVDLHRAATRCFVHGGATPASEKLLASIRKIPRFVEIAPGFVVRKGSTPAPPPPTTQTALALDEGGLHVAAGYVSGEILAVDTTTARVVSSHRGVIAAPRCRALRLADFDTFACNGRSDREVWLVDRAGEVLVANLETLELAPSGRLELPPIGEHAVCSLYLADERVVFVSHTHVATWARRDLSQRTVHALPEHKGAILIGSELVLVPKASVGHEGFDVVAMDPTTGESRTRARFERDAERFPLGNDPTKWIALGRAGDQPTIMIWAGKGMSVAQTFAFDVDAARLGVSLPWAVDGRGRAGMRLDPGRGEVVAFDLASAETIATAPIGEDDGGGLPAAFDESSRVMVAAFGSRIAVWQADGRRITLLGHRDVNSLWLGAGGRGLLVRDRFSLRLWDIA